MANMTHVFPFPEGKQEEVLNFLLEKLFYQMEAGKLLDCYIGDGEISNLVHDPEHSRLAHEMINEMPLSRNEFLAVFRLRFRADLNNIV